MQRNVVNAPDMCEKGYTPSMFDFRNPLHLHEQIAKFIFKKIIYSTVDGVCRKPVEIGNDVVQR